PERRSGWRFRVPSFHGKVLEFTLENRRGLRWRARGEKFGGSGREVEAAAGAGVAESRRAWS
ncbi:hypothetical protein TIFTF001_056765, partial [Ficus carica]